MKKESNEKYSGGKVTPKPYKSTLKWWIVGIVVALVIICTIVLW